MRGKIYERDRKETKSDISSHSIENHMNNKENNNSISFNNNAHQVVQSSCKKEVNGMNDHELFLNDMDT